MNECHHFQIGNFKCLAINDGGYAGNSRMLFATAPEFELEKALVTYGTEADNLPSTWTCLLVKSGDMMILIDTGTGEYFPYGGKLVSALQKEGIYPEDIDKVVLTHVHGDHILGCLDINGDYIFPRATYVMSQDEWAFWTQKKTLASAPEWMAETAQQILPTLADKMHAVAGAGVIVPGITMLPAPGHTHGHAGVEIESGGERLMVLADAALHPIHLEYPQWIGSVDQYAEQTVQTRLDLFRRAAQTRSLVLFFHFLPFPSLGYILEKGETWRWQPVTRNINGLGGSVA